MDDERAIARAAQPIVEKGNALLTSRRGQNATIIWPSGRVQRIPAWRWWLARWIPVRRIKPPIEQEIAEWAEEEMKEYLK